MEARLQRIEWHAVERRDLENTVIQMERELTPILETYNRRIMAVEQGSGGQVALGLNQTLLPRPDVKGGDAFTKLEAKLDAQILALEAKLNCQAVEVNGWWFCSVEDCISFAHDEMPEGEIQWFVDIVTLLQHVTEDCVTTEESKTDDTHSARVKQTSEQTMLIAAFKTDIPPMFNGPKEGREAKCPLPGISTPEQWNAHNGVTGVYP